MGVYSLTRSGINNWVKYSSMMAGSSYIIPPSDEMITEVILTGSQASITFDVSTLAASGYRHLQIRATSRTDVASTYVDTRIRFNSDSTANYSTHEMYGAGGTIASGGAPSVTAAGIAYSAGTSAGASNFASMIIDILDFSFTGKRKSLRGFSGIVDSSALVDIRSGAWYSTAAITSININLNSGNFVAGSRFSLYASKDN